MCTDIFRTLWHMTVTVSPVLTDVYTPLLGLWTRNEQLSSHITVGVFLP